MAEEIKVFRMNDCDWVAARTLEEAKAFYLEETGIEEEDAFECPAEETAIDLLRFHDEDGGDAPVVRTFREQLDFLISGGAAFPELFASTEW